LVTDITASFYQHYLPLYAKGKLADLGCGNVPFYGLYKNLVSENICVDWANSAHSNEYLDIECNLNEALPFKDSMFDTIIISEVLEHVANPEMLWYEMSRVLKSGGVIILSVPFLYKIHEAPFDYFRYTEFALRNFAIKNKLQVLELKPFGGLPEVLADIFGRQFIKIPILGKFFCIVSQKLCWIFIQTRMGRRISKKTSVTYPLGYFMIAEKPNGLIPPNHN
jgi:ubiquinone/menaquinone biosynthesis C-methylase UbiE